MNIHGIDFRDQQEGLRFLEAHARAKDARRRRGLIRKASTALGLVVVGGLVVAVVAVLAGR